LTTFRILSPVGFGPFSFPFSVFLVWLFSVFPPPRARLPFADPPPNFFVFWGGGWVKTKGVGGFEPRQPGQSQFYPGPRVLFFFVEGFLFHIYTTNHLLGVWVAPTPMRFFLRQKKVFFFPPFFVSKGLPILRALPQHTRQRGPPVGVFTLYWPFCFIPTAPPSRGCACWVFGGGATSR